MLHNAFDEITLSRGDELGITGMQVKMDCKNKAAILTQPKWEQTVNKQFMVTRKAPITALADRMAEDEELPFLPSQDQKKYMSLNSLMMYGATRTYPESLSATIKLASKYNKATEADMKKLTRV